MFLLRSFVYVFILLFTRKEHRRMPGRVDATIKKPSQHALKIEDRKSRWDLRPIFPLKDMLKNEYVHCFEAHLSYNGSFSEFRRSNHVGILQESSQTLPALKMFVIIFFESYARSSVLALYTPISFGTGILGCFLRIISKKSFLKYCENIWTMMLRKV